MKYRADIDGLRAVAVLPVIFFHAGFEFFSGGFVGVDIFFVLSGYLITTILIEEIDNDRFSLLDFYQRRARRILPALFFLLIVCIPFALMFMTNQQMKAFSQSLVAVGLFASNILFWLTSGYFSAAAESKPLLHTWSLAVEEQFYIIFPILLLFVWRLGKNKLIWLISLLAVISLILSEWGWRNFPSANFYLLPTRAWELLAGSICAFIVQTRGVRKNNMLSLLGLALIVISMLMYDKNTPFPSLYAVVPIMGTALLILYADKNAFTTKLLSTKAFVGIGLISYSAYLWHQPLLAFAHIIATNNDASGMLGLPAHYEKDFFSTSIIVCITLCLAYLSWRFIEKPFRNKSLNNKYIPNWYISSLLGLFFFISFGFWGHLYFKELSNNGIKISTSWPKDVRQHSCLLEKPMDYKHGEECLNQPADVVIWGDSHGASLSPGLRTQLIGKNKIFSQLTQSGCGPLNYIDVLVHRNNCNLINSNVLKTIINYKFQNVVIHAAWLHEHYPLSPNSVIDKLNPVIESLLKNIPQVNIVIVGAVPRWKISPKFHNVTTKDEQYMFSDTPYLLDEMNHLLKDFSNNKGINFVDPTDSFCNVEVGIKSCILAIRNKNTGDWVGVTTDYGHLSNEASNILAKEVIKYLSY